MAENYPKTSVVALQDIESLETTALDLSYFLGLSMNADISTHFPATVSRYSGDIDSVIANLQDAIKLCQPGQREQFISFAGPHAVGMSIITNEVTSPKGIDDGRPNVSGFILNPYRSQGLGRISLRHRVGVIRQRFGGQAWTYVRKGNVAAEKMVLGAGFRVTDLIEPGQEDQRIFVYESRPAQNPQENERDTANWNLEAIAPQEEHPRQPSREALRDLRNHYDNRRSR